MIQRISIHALLAESDKSSWSLTRLNRNISIHALLAESDGLGFCYHCDDVAFLSTLSLRRATAPNRRPCRCNKISIHALLAESDLFFIVFDLFRNISIHALLAESDLGTVAEVGCMYYISIHALLAESDMWLFNPSTPTSHFYPRSPCGERRKSKFSAPRIRNFYPRSPCGERQAASVKTYHWIHISIHALLAESDWLDFEY